MPRKLSRYFKLVLPFPELVYEASAAAGLGGFFPLRPRQYDRFDRELSQRLQALHDPEQRHRVAIVTSWISAITCANRWDGMKLSELSPAERDFRRGKMREIAGLFASVRADPDRFTAAAGDSAIAAAWAEQLIATASRWAHPSVVN